MKKAIIIGASSGIGNELAKILALNDYKIGITGRRKSNLDKLKKSNSNKYIVNSYDCTKGNNAKELDKLTNSLGGLDLLVLCAGTGDLNEKLCYDIENKTNQLNVIAFTEIVDWTYNYFDKKKKGHLVVITSIAGIRGGRISPAYNASKSYQTKYLEGLRQKAKYSKKKVLVTDIRPGFVDTKMAKGDNLFWVGTKEKVAKQIFSLVKRNKSIGYVTKRWRLISTLLKILPDWIYIRL